MATKAGSKSDTTVDKETTGSHLALENALILAEANAVQETERWQARASELCQESKKRRAKARKLIKQAEELEREEEKARSNACVTRTFTESLKFQTILSRLMRNDETLVEVDARQFPQGQGRPLGEALLRNTMVKKLELDIDDFVVAPSEHMATNEMKPLLDFIVNSRSLVHVAAKGYIGRDSPLLQKMSDLLLDAVSKNVRMQRLKWTLPVCSTAFGRILTSLPRLFNLDVGFKINSYSNTQRQAIASAFRSSKSLQQLALYIQDSEDLAPLIFESLAARATQSKLRVLRLKSPFDEDNDDDGFFDGLSEYLRSSRTLQRLYMDDFCWTDSSMTKLLSGLQHQDSGTGLPTISLRSLLFVRGSMDKEAGERLLMFLQTTITDLVGKEVYKSCLRQLGIGCQVDDLMTPTLSTQIAESLLMAAAAQTDPNADEVHRRQPTLMPTIGSQLDSLSVYHATRVSCTTCVTRQIGCACTL